MINMSDPREVLLLDMFNAYQHGISPSEWRRSNKTDFDFFREMEVASKTKQIRVQNQEALLKQMGA